jgi:hypothetical protein
MGPFQRTNEKMDQLGFVRGPARLLLAPLTQAIPTKIGDIIKLTGADVNEVQTLTLTGTPTGGTFTLTFKGVSTGPIAFNATAAAVQAALEGLSTIGTGGVVVAGGTPLPAGPLTITFSGTNTSASNQPLITGNPALLTGGATPTVSVVETTAGSGLYDPMGSWFDLGGTKTGIQVGYNNTEDALTIDQQSANIGTVPNTHEMWMQTALVENTPENIAIAWDSSAPVLNTTVTPAEKMVGYGTNSAYTQRRLAVVHRRSGSGLIRLHFLRIVERGAVESTVTYQTGGDQQSLPFRLNALVDSAVADEHYRFGFMIDQQPS